MIKIVLMILSCFQKFVLLFEHFKNTSVYNCLDLVKNLKENRKHVNLASLTSHCQKYTIFSLTRYRLSCNGNTLLPGFQKEKKHVPEVIIILKAYTTTVQMHSEWGYAKLKTQYDVDGCILVNQLDTPRKCLGTLKLVRDISYFFKYFTPWFKKKKKK